MKSTEEKVKTWVITAQLHGQISGGPCNQALIKERLSLLKRSCGREMLAKYFIYEQAARLSVRWLLPASICRVVACILQPYNTNTAFIRPDFFSLPSFSTSHNNVI